MSSHHFVREGQEPALFIAMPVPVALLEPLLEWVPFVLVTDDVVESIMSYGIKIDAVLLHQQNPGLKYAVELQQPVRWVHMQARDAVIATGLHYLQQQQQNHVHLFAHSNVAFDVLDPQHALPVTLTDPPLRWTYVHGLYEKWLPAQTVLRVRSKHTVFDKHGAHVTDVFSTQTDSLTTLHAVHPFWVGEHVL